MTFLLKPGNKYKTFTYIRKWEREREGEERREGRERRKEKEGREGREKERELVGGSARGRGEKERGR